MQTTGSPKAFGEALWRSHARPERWLAQPTEQAMQPQAYSSVPAATAGRA